MMKLIPVAVVLVMFAVSQISSGYGGDEVMPSFVVSMSASTGPKKGDMKDDMKDIDKRSLSCMGPVNVSSYVASSELSSVRFISNPDDHPFFDFSGDSHHLKSSFEELGISLSHQLTMTLEGGDYILDPEGRVIAHKEFNDVRVADLRCKAGQFCTMDYVPSECLIGCTALTESMKMRADFDVSGEGLRMTLFHDLSESSKERAAGLFEISKKGYGGVSLIDRIGVQGGARSAEYSDETCFMYQYAAQNSHYSACLNKAGDYVEQGVLPSDGKIYLSRAEGGAYPRLVIRMHMSVDELVGALAPPREEDLFTEHESVISSSAKSTAISQTDGGSELLVPGQEASEVSFSDSADTTAQSLDLSLRQNRDRYSILRDIARGWCKTLLRSGLCISLRNHESSREHHKELVVSDVVVASVVITGGGLKYFLSQWSPDLAYLVPGEPDAGEWLNGVAELTGGALSVAEEMKEILDDEWLPAHRDHARQHQEKWWDPHAAP